MTHDALAAFDQRLRQRRIAFVEKALNGWSDIENWCARFERNQQDAEALEALTRFFHKLAGAAGIYELMDISDLAVEAETYCLKKDSDDDKASGISGYIRRTKEAFERAAYP